MQAEGSMFQKECGDHGNCESEFTAKTAYLGLRAARFCWRGDDCRSDDNEPEDLILFIHQSGARSPGHYQQKGA